jgi:hypothetical protein
MFLIRDRVWRCCRPDGCWLEHAASVGVQLTRCRSLLVFLLCVVLVALLRHVLFLF